MPRALWTGTTTRTDSAILRECTCMLHAPLCSATTGRRGPTSPFTYTTFLRRVRSPSITAPARASFGRRGKMDNTLSPAPRGCTRTCRVLSPLFRSACEVLGAAFAACTTGLMAYLLFLSAHVDIDWPPFLYLFVALPFLLVYAWMHETSSAACTFECHSPDCEARDDDPVPV